MSKLLDLLPVPAGINPGLNGTGNSLMLSVLGNPRSSFNKDCQQVTNATLKKRMVTKSVGPFRVTGLDLAVDSLTQVMADIKAQQRAVHDVLSTAGMLCCRLVRGSTSSISNHSWGTAVDLKIEDVLDARGNNKVQRGLTLVAPVFNSHGWFWGAGFSIEDGMHFEVSKQKLQQWQADGKLLGSATLPDEDALAQGDRGDQVAELQKKLNKLGEKLVADGIFGPATRAAVIAFQARNSLSPDGVAGKRTLEALKKATG